MPHLKFTCTGATLHSGYQRGEPKTGSMTLTLKTERFDSITSKAGVELSKWEWSIQLLDTDIYNPTAEKDNYIGVAKSWPANEGQGNTCWMSAVVGKSVFQRLLIAIEAGKLPSYVGVDVEGLTYGHDPDGRDVIWDTEKHETLWLKEINFAIPIAGLVETEDKFTDEVIANAAPVSVGDLHHFKTALLSEMQGMTKKLYTPILLTAIAAVLVAVKVLF